MARSARQRMASRRNLIKARRKRQQDTFGYWAAKGVKKVASVATFGASGIISEFARKNKQKKRRR